MYGHDRKSWNFCWTELGAKHVGVAQSLIVTCRLHGVDPYTYLVDVLQRVGQMTTVNSLYRDTFPLDREGVVVTCCTTNRTTPLLASLIDRSAEIVDNRAVSFGGLHASSSLNREELDEL